MKTRTGYGNQKELELLKLVVPPKIASCETTPGSTQRVCICIFTNFHNIGKPLMSALLSAIMSAACQTCMCHFRNACLRREVLNLIIQVGLRLVCSLLHQDPKHPLSEKISSFMPHSYCQQDQKCWF